MFHTIIDLYHKKDKTMKNDIQINPDLYCITIPYKDIFTTVYLIKTEEGVLVFDTATYDYDIEDIVLPVIDELGFRSKVKYVFISHAHRDHWGGLKTFLSHFPDAVVISRKDDIDELYCGYNCKKPEEGEIILGVLQVVAIPGHTIDSAGLLDIRDNTLISGDCLQMYGIYGSGEWGANITFPALHYSAIEKLRSMNINSICTAHDYHPVGRFIQGKERVKVALDSCIEPLDEVKRLINENPALSDNEISEMYNSTNKLPTLAEKVVRAMRAMQ